MDCSLSDLCIGITLDIFSSSGKVPSLIDRLIKCVVVNSHVCVLVVWGRVC